MHQGPPYSGQALWGGRTDSGREPTSPPGAIEPACSSSRSHHRGSVRHGGNSLHRRSRSASACPRCGADHHVDPPPGSTRPGPVRLPTRLLPQPGGFEGLAAVGVSTEASDQSTAEVGDPRRRCVDGDTAVLSLAADASQGKSGVSGVANFVNLPAEGLPGLIDSRAVLGASVVALIDGPFQDRSPARSLRREREVHRMPRHPVD